MNLKKAGVAEAQEVKGSRLDVTVMQQGTGQIIFGQASRFRDVFSLRVKTLVGFIHGWYNQICILERELKV